MNLSLFFSPESSTCGFLVILTGQEKPGLRIKLMTFAHSMRCPERFLWQTSDVPGTERNNFWHWHNSGNPSSEKSRGFQTTLYCRQTKLSAPSSPSWSCLCRAETLA